jgi:AraC-like DNA-binding protein
LPELAGIAGMSRSSFAAVFKQHVGSTPGEYLAAYRLCIAQGLLRRGVPMKQIAMDVGYGSTAALSRAFKAGCGASPREWKNAAESNQRPDIPAMRGVRQPPPRQAIPGRRALRAS